MPVKQISIKI